MGSVGTLKCRTLETWKLSFSGLFLKTVSDETGGIEEFSTRAFFKRSRSLQQRYGG
jgi:hypothetical protein